MFDRIRLFINCLIGFGALCIALAAVVGFSPSIERRFFPVASDAVAYDWRYEGPGRWSADIRMVKHRSCRPNVVWGRNSNDGNLGEGKAATVLNPASPPPYEVPITYLDDDTPGSSHPAMQGRQSFGRWAFGSAGRPVYPGNRLIFEPRSDCHGLFDSTSRLGPITIDEGPP